MPRVDGHFTVRVNLVTAAGPFLGDAPCGAGRQLIKLIGAGENYPTGLIWDAVSAVNADEPAYPLYLQVIPASSAS